MKKESAVQNQQVLLECRHFLALQNTGGKTAAGRFHVAVSMIDSDDPDSIHFFHVRSSLNIFVQLFQNNCNPAD